MDKRIALDDIVRAQAEKKDFQADWNRQRATARAITERFGAGFDTVLLADEVGMGKTYVALNVMAEHLMQTCENDRKVLLITPPSSVLRDKWEQEIRSFDAKYIDHTRACTASHHGQDCPRQSKRLLPLQVGDYWTLLRNLNDFADHHVQRADNLDAICFLHFFNLWENERKRKHKHRSRNVRWPALQKLNVESITFYRFCAHFSEHAIYAFLNERNGADKLKIDSLVQALRSDTCPDWEIRNLFKQFARQQDRFEANIFIMSMGALKKPYSNSDLYRQLCKFLLGRCWSGLQYPTRETMARTLEGAGVLPPKQGHYWKDYVEQVNVLAKADLYGLTAAADAVLATEQHAQAWQALSTCLRARSSDGAEQFFASFCEALLLEKLRQANVGLAVVDEVHNWKGGKLGARNFSRQYAPGIAHKLIVSATPFQIEEGEIKRLFDFVADPLGKSVATIDTIFGEPGEVAACLKASQDFNLAWQQLSEAPEDAALLAELLHERDLAGLPVLIDTLVDDSGRSDVLRGFFAAARAHRTAVSNLQQRLCKIVVRHTKQRKKRNFSIGADFSIPNTAAARNALYLGRGYAGKNDALINFVGMRLGLLVRRDANGTKKENGRLLSGITSSRAAFRESQEKMTGKNDISPGARAYGVLFDQLLEKSIHPKVDATVRHALANIEDGRKTLIFCERVATLDEIQTLLLAQIRKLLEQRSSQGALQRDTLLANTAFVDNAWWLSLLRATQEPAGDVVPLTAREFAKSAIARGGMKATPRRTIRLVDLHMLATPRAIALMQKNGWTSMARILAALFATTTGEEANAALASLLNAETNNDETYIEEALNDEAESDIDDAIERVYVQRGNLWQSEGDGTFHQLLWQLMESEATQLLQADDDPAGKGFALASIMSDLFEGLRKIVLRDDLIGRYDYFSKEDDRTERIRDGFCNMPVGHETMLARASRFLDALLQESGSINRALRQNSKRQSLWQGVFLQKVERVETLSGRVSDPDRRRRLCAAFNSPLMPDVLICTSIGSEGIDLHRYCAEVIHHDLPWNPARLEQRNGRVDRVNSLAENTTGLHIEIGIPFLAHNYEEFQYRKVYSRAQKFEILLGRPDYSLDIDEESFSDNDAVVRDIEEQDGDLSEQEWAVIPEVLVDYLRMDLSVVPS